jgi:hypothetical protein
MGPPCVGIAAAAQVSGPGALAGRQLTTDQGEVEGLGKPGSQYFGDARWAASSQTRRSGAGTN